jgi:hypothetical protein
MNPLIQFKQTILPLLIVFVLGCFGLSPTVQADPFTEDPDSSSNGSFTGNNTAEGDGALLFLLFGPPNLRTGRNNTALGFNALLDNASGNDNTATGQHALEDNTTGSGNTASGSSALQTNTTGHDNMASGVNALLNNTTGNANTASGNGALVHNTMGSNNTASGVGALANNTTGSNNIAVGVNAGLNLTIGSNNIDIGNEGVGAEANTIRVGVQGTQTATFIAGIFGVTGGTKQVCVDSNGRLTTCGQNLQASSKTESKSMGKANEAKLAQKVRNLEATVATLVATVKEQAALIQRVSAQLELSKSAPQTVVNNQ